MKNRPTRVAGLLLILAALIAGYSLIPRPTAPVGSQLRKSQEKEKSRVFEDFQTWLDRHSKAETAALEQGLTLARARRVEMERLIREDPKEALAQSVSLDVWKKLPAAIRDEVEEPFSALGNYRVLPVCGGHDDHSKHPDAVRYLDVPGQPTLASFVFGRRMGLASKQNSPVQGIRLGKQAALREEVFQQLSPSEAAAATGLYPVAAEVDFATGEALGAEPVVALAGGKIFKFRDAGSLASFEQAIAALDAKPGFAGGAGLMFLPFPATGSGGFNLPEAILRNNNLASTLTETKKKVFMIRCDFSDKTNAAFPVVAAGTYAALLNTTVSNNIRDFSYGKTWIEASVSSAVIRLPHTAAYYAVQDTNFNSRNDLLLSEAKAAYLALNPTFNEFDYDIVGTWFVSLGMAHGGITYAGLAGGRDIWIQGTTDAAVHVHEFGHNYGLLHSSFWVPPGASTNPVDTNGANEEYGDPFDVMGSGPVPEGVFHSEAKKRLNWLSTGDRAEATTGSATYRIHRIDHPDTTGIRGLRVKKAARESYWLSYRRSFSNNWLKAGANIVWEQEDYGRSWLIDTTPGSLSGNDDRTDGSLAIGRTYADAAAGVYITPLARGGSSPDEYLDVRVNFGPFSGNTGPAVTLAGPSAVNARQTCAFTAQATDPDGDELAYSWDFGQGFTFDNHNTATYSWNSGGTFLVKVTVSDMKGHSTVASKFVTVSDPITTWTARANTATGDFTDLAASPSRVIAVSHDYSAFKGSITTSTDGISWTTNLLSNNQYGYAATWDGSRFLLAGEAVVGGDFAGCVFSSTTGTGSWTTSVNTGATLRGIAFGGGVYVVVGDGGIIRSSTNGTTWTARVSGTTNTLESVAYGGGKFVAVGRAPDTINDAGFGDCTVLTSSDGVTWTNTSSGAGVESWQDFRKVVWASDRFLASGWFSKLKHSTNLGVSFSTSRTTSDDTPAMAYGNGVWFAAGTTDPQQPSEVDIDLVSTDGANWTPLTTPSLDNRKAAIFFNNTFITAGDNHTIRQSGAITTNANGYITWREGAFPDHGPLSDPTGDNDGDTLGNLLEYALGTSPVSSAGVNGAAVLPQAVRPTTPASLSDRIALQFNLPEPAAADLRYVVEASNTLTGSWSPLATKVGTGAWTWNGGGTSRIVLGTASGGKIPVTIGDSQAAGISPARFLRLRTAVNQ